MTIKFFDIAFLIQNCRNIIIRRITETKVNIKIDVKLFKVYKNILYQSSTDSFWSQLFSDVFGCILSFK